MTASGLSSNLVEGIPMKDKFVSLVFPHLFHTASASEIEIAICSASSMLMLGGNGGKVAGRDGVGGNISFISSLL